MNNNKLMNRILSLLILSILFSCSKDFDDLELATYPDIPEIFIDDFSAGLNYSAFGGSNVFAFQVDTETTFKGEKSMRFDVPAPNTPEGSYAGGEFFTTVGRDLTGYEALTFWAKATQTANIDLIGFGRGEGEERTRVQMNSTQVTTTWRKYYIPLPDPARLTKEDVMLFYAEPPEDGKAYTFWLDEVQFEKLGTLAHPKAAIFNGEDQETFAETGNKLNVSGLQYSANLPNGVDQIVEPIADYFTFVSSDPSVASVNSQGEITILDEGTAVITATLGELEAQGSLSITSSGAPLLPQSPAPTPDEDASDVISIFSNQYTDEPVDFYNGYWLYSTTESEVRQIDNDDILRYYNLNFVGIQFTSPTIDITSTNTFHIDLWTPDATEPVSDFKILLVDLGPDGSFEGNDNTSHELTITNPTLVSEDWISLDIPLSSFSGLTGRSNLAQIVLSSASIKNVFVDNIYFYQGEDMGGNPIPPDAPAPTPSFSASDVISIYSDTYNNIPVEGYNLYGNAMFEEVNLSGNNTLKYTGTPMNNFQVIEFGGANQIDLGANGMTHFHFDIWFPNAVDPTTAFLMKVVNIPAGDLTEALINISPSSNPAMEQGEWLSFDIPIALLQSNGLGGINNIQQVVIDLVNSGEAYIDNLLFYKDDGSSGGYLPPTEEAPSPSQAGADVISIYSDSYNSVPNEGYNLYGNAMFEEVQINGNNMLKYTGTPMTNFQVIELGGGNQIDAEAAGMTTFHFDLWFSNELSTDAAFLLKLVDIPTSGLSEALINVNADSNPAIEQGQWLSFDIPFSVLETIGLNGKSNIQQVVVDLINTGEVFIDNIYLYK